MAHRFQSRHRKHLAANFTDEVAAQINGILHSIQTGESIKPNCDKLIPAHAGVILDTMSGCTWKMSYPRVCGGDPGRERQSRSGDNLSPRMRG